MNTEQCDSNQSFEQVRMGDQPAGDEPVNNQPSGSGPSGDRPDMEEIYSAYKEPQVKESKKKKHVVANVFAGLGLAAAASLMTFGGLKVAGYLDQKAAIVEQGENGERATLTHSDDKADDRASKSSDAVKAGDEVSERNAAAPTISTTERVSAEYMDVSAVVEEVMPSVVAVTNETVYKVTGRNWSWFGGGSSEYPATGAGSGVIIGENDEELLIVTNAHVVLPTDYSSYGYSVDSSEISIIFCNDDTVDAYIKGYDEEADLAVVGVKLDDIDQDTLDSIKIATVGNSDNLKPGNGVIAIGNALGFGQSVTVGYVSALNRNVTINGVTRTLLQTDAAINPGNSGGGLFNINGELIGINSAKYASEDVEGIGYAIPITSAGDIIEDLMNRTTVVREKVTDEDKICYLGVYSSTEYSSNYGVLIGDTVENGPAEKAGLASYDIITAIGDRKVSTWDEMVDELAYYEGGETVTITYYTIEGSGRNREYVEKTTNVTLGFRKDYQENNKQ